MIIIANEIFLYFLSLRKGNEVWTSTTGAPKWNQSPIDLNPMYTIHHHFPPLILQGYLSCKGVAKMKNIGSTVQIKFTSERGPKLMGGPLSDAYRFSNVQFRWGSTNAVGAEHSIDGVWFSMEAQLIHWNTTYGSIETCYDKPDGIAILAFLFQVIGCPGMPDNPNFSEITNNLVYIKMANKQTDISSDCLKWIMEVCSKPGYFTYNGSLTTPPYSECATWIIIPRPIVISARQIDAFRSLYNNKTEHITSNYRPQQKIQYRKIFYDIALNRKKQSPIDVLDMIVQPICSPSLILNGHWLNDGKAYLMNDGTRAVVTLSGERTPSIIKSGPLNDEYEFLEAHFYWGEDNCNGSNHTINGSWYSMEAQIVHWNRKYDNFDECLKYEDGLCILTFLFLVHDSDDCISCINLEKITDNLKKIIKKDSITEIPANSLCWMRIANCCKYYYFYNGSYNEGNSPECALWIIFPNYIPIGSNQIAAFRELKDAKGREIKSNKHKIQPLGDRRIYRTIF